MLLWWWGAARVLSSFWGLGKAGRLSRLGAGGAPEHRRGARCGCGPGLVLGEAGVDGSGEELVLDAGLGELAAGHEHPQAEGGPVGRLLRSLTGAWRTPDASAPKAASP